MQTEKQILASGEKVESRAGNLEKRDQQLMSQIRQRQKKKRNRTLNKIKKIIMDKLM